MYDTINATKPWSSIYFVLLMIIGKYMILNLLIAIVMNKMEILAASQVKEKEAKAKAAAQAAAQDAELEGLHGSSDGSRSPGGSRVSASISLAAKTCS